MEGHRTIAFRSPRSLLVAAGIAAVVSALCILALDAPVARWLWGYERLGFWDPAIEVLEWTIGLPLFKWTSGLVLALGMVVTAAVPRWRWQAPAWMLLTATHVLARIATLEVKLATARLRPSAWIVEGGGETFFHPPAHGFPSGHVTLFASILIPLAVILPRTRPLLAIVGFVMLARVAVSAHFLSDVIAAITLVCLVTWACAKAIEAAGRRR